MCQNLCGPTILANEPGHFTRDSATCIAQHVNAFEIVILAQMVLHKTFLIRFDKEKDHGVSSQQPGYCS